MNELNEIKYDYKDVPVSWKHAVEARAKQEKTLKDDIKDLQKHLSVLIAAPLPRTSRQLVKILPGDDGYEEAPYSASVHTVEYPNLNIPTK